MAQPLDRRAAEKEKEDLKPGNPRVNALVQDLLVELGEDWTQDDHTGGTVVSFRQVLSLLVEDVGFDILGVNALMPEEFMPQLGFQCPFDVKPDVIARMIKGSLLQMYLKVTDIALDVRENEERWEKQTKEQIAQWAARTGVVPRVEVLREPGLCIHAFFKRENGGTLRMILAPGATPVLHVYTAAHDDGVAYLTLWHELHPPKENAEQ